MSWFKRLSGMSEKGKEDDRRSENDMNPYHNQQHFGDQTHQQPTLHPSNPFYTAPPAPNYSAGDYAPPNHPPPGASGADYAPPSYPPPGASGADYAPPSHPPPHLSNNATSSYPADKKQSHPPTSDELPPDYCAVPPGFSAVNGAAHTSYPSYSFPTHNPIHHLFSNANNASHDAFAAGNRYCNTHPLEPPLVAADPSALARILAGNIIMQPDAPHNHITINSHTTPSSPNNPTSTILITKKRCPDTTILSQVPLYAARYHYPSQFNPTTVIGYHLTITALPLDGDSVVAFGFACIPYPPFRLPGWQRGSLAIHSDDGRKYCNDGYGGVDFTRPLQQGERFALGLVIRWVGETSSGPVIETEAVFVRNGQKEGGWLVRHEGGAGGRGDPTIGFGGDRDVFAAVGVTGGKGVECQVRVMGRQEAWGVVLGREAPLLVEGVPENY